MSNNLPNLVFIISGPSGVGKSTLIHRVMSQDPRLAFSISHTTRPPRPGEKDGRDYYFVTRVQGARQVMERLDRNRWTSIFILPPDLKALEQRLIARGKDPKDRIARRLKIAEQEIAQAERYDYRIVNDVLERATRDLKNIIERERTKHFHIDR
ncbi:MAG: guanylate kinase [Deltaproteobacteria bacterium]|nr:guanylate kinase [Deltaproteobacteria bacterium]